MFLVGTYAHCGNAVGMHTDSNTCMSRPDNRLVWFQDGGGSVNMKRPKPCSSLFSEMQGAVSVSTNDTTTLLISSSYGPYADSHLHIVRNFDRRSCKMTEDDFQHCTTLRDLKICTSRRTQKVNADIFGDSLSSGRGWYLQFRSTHYYSAYSACIAV